MRIISVCSPTSADTGQELDAGQTAPAAVRAADACAAFWHVHRQPVRTTSHCFRGELTCTARSSVREEYMPAMRLALTAPMWGAAHGGREKDGIPQVMELMNDYSLTR